jgi:hypothetical protein
MRMVFQPVARDVDAASAPNLVFFLYIFQKSLERGDAARPAGEPAVQSDRHHARRAAALFIESTSKESFR